MTGRDRLCGAEPSDKTRHEDRELLGGLDRDLVPAVDDLHLGLAERRDDAVTKKGRREEPVADPPTTSAGVREPATSSAKPALAQSSIVSRSV